ncbi:helicase RepA family protein [Rickettsiaceae bacterium]|nr:helicase RepA family protein [Rickettsiaceae bacterium]
MSDVTPNQDDIKIFMHVVFSGCSGFVPYRSFAEKGSRFDNKPNNTWFEADENIVENTFKFANSAASQKMSCFVIPGKVAEPGKASADDIIEMQTLLIDIDSGDTEEKLSVLSHALGQPTMIVESGGITEEGNAKLHVYWQLVHSMDGADLQKLLQLRHQIALAVGGDVHFKSAHQPIRVAGSVYHKGGVNKLVKIRSYEPVEYELDELINAAENLPRDHIVREESSGEIITTPSMPLSEVMKNKVYEGGEGEFTRFSSLQRVVGHWLRLYHSGAASKEEAWNAILDYNEASVVPAWPEDRLKSMVDGLWKKHVKENGELEEKSELKINSYSLGTYLKDNTVLPEDIIAPRILTPGGMFVFGGAPKVGKSDFLLSLFTNMAAGKEFLGFTPPRPLKIFYFQAEIGYHYLRERLQNMQLSDDVVKLAEDNLHITPNTRLMLNEQTVGSLAKHILSVFPEGIDIIAVDPIRNVFDGGRDGATENENDAMLFFLQQRIEALRDAINPDAGIVLVHHTKKLSQKQFDEEPFAAFSGASSLRSYYTSGAILRRSEVNSAECELFFELRNGAAIETKILSKHKGKWFEENQLERPIINVNKSVKLDAERDRREQLILDILSEEAKQGRAYTIGAFCEAFDGLYGLSSSDSIRARVKILMRRGNIKFFKNTIEYGMGKCTSKYGLMCFEDMELVDKNGEIHSVLPTHYKHHELDDFFPVENPHSWVVYGEKSL